MTREEAKDLNIPKEIGEQIEFPETFERFAKEYGFKDDKEVYTNGSDLIPIFRVNQWLEHQMTAEEYRQRMIQAFHNTDCDELIALCVLPTEKEFENLEWLLKNHYKKEPCGDAISRQAVLDAMYDLCDTGETLKENPWRDNPHIDAITDAIDDLPPVTPQQRTGRWIDSHISESTLCECSECGFTCGAYSFNYCPDCGAKMEVEE